MKGAVFLFVTALATIPTGAHAQFEVNPSTPRQRTMPGRLQVSGFVGGMTVEAPMPLEVDSEHQFTLGIEGEKLEVSGVVRNCERVSTDQAPITYRVGVEFCRLTDGQKKIFAEFVRKNRKD